MTLGSQKTTYLYHFHQFVLILARIISFRHQESSPYALNIIVVSFSINYDLNSIFSSASQIQTISSEFFKTEISVAMICNDLQRNELSI